MLDIYDVTKIINLGLDNPVFKSYPEDKKRFMLFVNDTFRIFSTYVASGDIAGLIEFKKDFDKLTAMWYEAWRNVERSVKKFSFNRLFQRSFTDPFGECNKATKDFVSKHDYDPEVVLMFKNYK